MKITITTVLLFLAFSAFSQSASYSLEIVNDTLFYVNETLYSEAKPGDKPAYKVTPIKFTDKAAFAKFVGDLKTGYEQKEQEAKNLKHAFEAITELQKNSFFKK